MSPSPRFEANGAGKQLRHRFQERADELMVESGTPQKAAATATKGQPDRPTIQSVERAARILDFFTASRPWLTLTEITERLGVSKATAHRYAVALREVNLLRYDRAAAVYTLGPQVLTLASAARAGLPILSLAAPLMEQIVRDLNETAVLSVWDGSAPVVVRVDDRTQGVIRISVRDGSRLDLLNSAQGRVFSAFLVDEGIPPLNEALERAPELARELETVRREGIAINTPEVHGVRTMAAPVFSDGSVVAVMAIVGTTASISNDVESPEAHRLKQAADRLTELFGARSGDESVAE